MTNAANEAAVAMVVAAITAIEKYLHAIERERLVIEGRVREAESGFFSMEGRPKGVPKVLLGLG